VSRPVASSVSTARDRVRQTLDSLGLTPAFEAFSSRLDAASDALIAGAAMILDKPYGRNILALLDPAFGISLVQMRPRAATSLHVHHRRREIFVIRSGALTLFQEGRSRRLGPWEVAQSTPASPHRLANDGEEPLEILELFAPNLLDDKVRLEDRYHRVLGPVDHRR
jgi:mannose-6-phosphate isomerase-like protein (cupin superfamily)